MKKMLIAASALGATLAGLILYYRRQRPASKSGMLNGNPTEALHAAGPARETKFSMG